MKKALALALFLLPAVAVAQTQMQTPAFSSVGLGTPAPSAGYADALNGYEVGGIALSASNLSNGTTGTGAITLAMSPALLGIPTVPTAATGTATAQIANTQFVQNQILAMPGLIGVQTFTASSTYTPDPGTEKIIVVDQAPGGGTGGCEATTSTTACVVGGSGAGSYAEALILSGFSGATVTIGAPGSGGSAGEYPGTTGGTSIFGSFISCPGGNYSPGAPVEDQTLYVVAGVPAARAAACTVTGAITLESVAGSAGFVGATGGYGVSQSASGAGGNSPLGFGGTPGYTPSYNTGWEGTGYGSGASGPVLSASMSAIAGQPGSPSEILVYEFN
jgi:hypothetical protein